MLAPIVAHMPASTSPLVIGLQDTSAWLLLVFLAAAAFGLFWAVVDWLLTGIPTLVPPAKGPGR